MPLAQIADGVWTDRHPVRIVGMPLSATMTVLRLPDDDLIVHSPVALTEQRRSEVEALGTVRHLLAPNLFHHQWLLEWATAFTDAELCVPPGLPKKREDLPAERVRTLTPGTALSDSIELVPIDGCRLGEIALWYRPARVLVVADLVHNIGRPEGAWTRFYTKTMGFYDRVTQSRVLRWTAYSDTALARCSVDRLLERDFDMLIVGHGAPVLTGGKAALTEGLSWLE